jgi:Family of unknown function (DUF6352)
MRKYWPQSNYQYLTVNQDNQLILTDEFLRSYLSRPELALIPESCSQEQRIHQQLFENPLASIDPAEIKKMADPDIQVNYEIWLRFRDKLCKAKSIESFYLSLFEGSGVDVPPLFVDQLTQILCQHLLGDNPTAFEARAAELLFRTQKITISDDGHIMCADEQTVEKFAQTGGFGSIGELLKQNDAPLRTIDLDVLSKDNSDEYWGQNDNYNFVLQLNFDQAGAAALAGLLEKWVFHFHGTKVKITAQGEITDSKWSWHIGLDVTASEILNALYKGQTVDNNKLAQVLCLFKLEFIDQGRVMTEIAGKPVYLGIAHDSDKCLKFKPQNLLINLPLAETS